MNILLLRADDGGCGFYRMLEPARVAQANGLNVTTDTSLPVIAYSNPDGTVEVEEITVDVDLIVFQRPLLRTFCDVIEYAQLHGIACAVELDDDLSSVHPHNGAWRDMQPETQAHSNHTWVRRAADMADLVIASTPAIARKYALHGRSVVLRNQLPESVFTIEKRFPDQPRVGWSGSVGTHPYDLDVAGVHVGSILARHDASLSVVGDGEHVRQKFYLQDTTPDNITGWVALEDYMQTVADNIDIGLAPLELSQFNDAKSYLKLLEMSGLGIPFVASPTSEYLLFQEKFGGRIAKRGRDWQKHISTLLKDRDLMLEEGAALRAAVRGETYEANIERWVDAWRLAIDNRKQKM